MMDNVTKDILNDLKHLGWENTRFDSNGVALESDSNVMHEGITITKMGIQLYNVKCISNQELDLLYRLRNKWKDM